MAIAPKPKKKSSGFLYQISGYANVALAPLLVLQCAVLWFVGTDGELPLPDVVRTKVRGRLEEMGVSLDWRDGSISLAGRVELHGVTVGSSIDDGKVIEVSKVVAMLDMYSLLLKGEVRPSRLSLDKGKLLCPAILSPTGKSEVAFRDVRATLVREGSHFVIETMQARCGDVPLVAYGRVVVPPSLKEKPAPSSGGEASVPAKGGLWREPALVAAKIVEHRHRLRILKEPSIELLLGDTGRGTSLDVKALAKELRYEGVTLDEVSINAGLLWDSSGVRPSRAVVLEVGSTSVSRPAERGVPAIEGGAAAMRLVSRFGPAWELPHRAWFSVVSPVINGNPVDRMDLVADWSAFPKLAVRSTVSLGRNSAVSRTEWDTDSGALQSRFDARLFQGEVMAYPAFPKSIPAELASLRFTDFVDVGGDLTLGSGYTFEKVAVSLAAGQTNFGAIDVQTFTGGVRATPEWLTAHDLRLISPTQRVEGLFETGFTATARYRLALKGRAYPDQVSPFVGAWWHRIWEDLSVTPGYPVAADIYVDGHWDGVPYQFIFGEVGAEKFGYQGVVFDRARIRILEEPTRIAIYDLHLENNDKAAAGGRLEWVYRMPDHELDSVRFLFTGELPLATGATLGGPEVVDALSGLKVEGSARARVNGRYHGPASPTPGRDQLQVDVGRTGRFVAWGLPGEAFKGTVLIDGRRIRIKDAKMKFADGDVVASAWLHRYADDYRLTFDASFTGCDRELFFEGLAALKAGDAPERKPVKAEPVVPAVKSELSGNVRARVALSDLDTLDGFGQVNMIDPALFKLPLFGAFSRGLDRVGINATTYHFDKAEADFILRRGTVYFPKLTILGPDAVVDAGGRYELASGALNFRAVLNPNAPDSIPVLDWARSFVNRGTRLFPVDVVGTLENPEWSIDPTPSALFRSGNVDLLGLPPAPERDDGHW